jgi:hypothetical protein
MSIDKHKIRFFRPHILKHKNQNCIVFNMMKEAIIWQKQKQKQKKTTTSKLIILKLTFRINRCQIVTLMRPLSWSKSTCSTSRRFVFSSRKRITFYIH